MTTRKAYSKPKIDRVNLIPDEAVLDVCKAGGTVAGPGTPSCVISESVRCLADS